MKKKSDPKTNKLRGGCACGKARYQLLAEPMRVHCCHCTDCQRHTGSAFVLNAIIETSAIRITRGVVEAVPVPALTGRTTFIGAANARRLFGVTTVTARKSDSFALEPCTTRVSFRLTSTFTRGRKFLGLSFRVESPHSRTITNPKGSGQRKAWSD